MPATNRPSGDNTSWFEETVRSSGIERNSFPVAASQTAREIDGCWDAVARQADDLGRFRLYDALTEQSPVGGVVFADR